jgi:hypothetical protein
MTLVLHAGAKAIEYGDLRELDTPKGTATHIPLPHFRLVDMVRNALGTYGHKVIEQHHGVMPDGNRYFGVLTLESEYTGYTDMVGLRNSHDKSMPVGVAFGSTVFVCDNTAFSAEKVVKVRHTSKMRTKLLGAVEDLIEPIALQREAQHKKYLTYQRTAVNDNAAYAALIQMYREGVINLQRIPEVLEQWEKPSCDWGDETAWRLFNAATFVLHGKVSENPQATIKLHQVIDGVCERIAA